MQRLTINDLAIGESVRLGDITLTIKAQCGDTIALEVEGAQEEVHIALEGQATTAAR